MFALIRAFSYGIAALCSINVFFHARALSYIQKLGAKGRAYPYLAALPPALLNLFLMRNAFSTGWMACLHASLILLIADALALAAKCFGKSARRAFTRWIRRGLAFALAFAYIAFGLINMRVIRKTDYALFADECPGQMKIALIADVHLGTAMDPEGFEKALSRAEGADMLVLAGDIADESTQLSEFSALCEALSKVSFPLGAYFVFGNHDGAHYGGTVDESAMETLLTNAGVTVLTDESVLLNGWLRVAGRKPAGDRDRMRAEQLLSGANAESEYIIVIDHQPAETQAVSAAGADLLLSGHTHNGQIWPINLISEWFDINEIEYGHETVGDMDAVVTSGIAGWGCAFRTSGVSEYVILTINGEN